MPSFLFPNTLWNFDASNPAYKPCKCGQWPKKGSTKWDGRNLKSHLGLLHARQTLLRFYFTASWPLTYVIYNTCNMFNWTVMPKCFPNWSYQLALPPVEYEDSHYCNSFLIFGIVGHFNFYNSSGDQMLAHWVLIYIFLITIACFCHVIFFNDPEDFFFSFTEKTIQFISVLKALGFIKLWKRVLFFTHHQTQGGKNLMQPL